MNAVSISAGRKGSTSKIIRTVFAFLLGLSLNDNIFAVFSVGSTYFYFGQLLSIGCFLMLLLFDFASIQRSFKSIPLGLKLFMIIVVLSLFFGALTTNYREVYMGRSLASFILLSINAITLIDVVTMKNNIKSLIVGLMIGLFFNIAFSLFAYFCRLQGIIFSLKAYSIRQFDFTTQLYNFRTQGMFLEPSHFIRYVVIVFFLLFGYYVHTKKKISFLNMLLLIALLLASILSSSGNLVIWMIGIILLLFLVFFNMNVRAKKIALIVAIGFLVFLSFLIIVSYSLNFDILYYFKEASLGANITYKGNSERFNSILFGLEVLKDNPIGIGWGMSPTLFSDNGYIACFSFILSTAIEIGVFGALIYLFSIMHLSIKLIKKKDFFSISLAVGLICLLMLQGGTDYAFDSLIMSYLGICILISTNPTKKKKG